MEEKYNKIVIHSSDILSDSDFFHPFSISKFLTVRVYYFYNLKKS